MRKLVVLFALALASFVSAQNVYVDDAGTVRKAQRVYVDDAGTVREIQRIYVDDAGTVRLVYQNAVFSLGDGSCNAPLGGAEGEFLFFSAGTFSYQVDLGGSYDSGNWITPTSLAPGSYTLRMHVNSGAASIGPSAADSDLALSSNRTWNFNASSNITFTLKDGGGATVLTASCNFTI